MQREGNALRLNLTLHDAASEEDARPHALLLDRFYTELCACFALNALVLDPRLDALKSHAGFEELRKRKGER